MTTAHTAGVLVCLALVQACSDGDVASDAEVDATSGDAGEATCVGRAPDESAPQSTVSGTGSVEQDERSLTGGALISGYALRYHNDLADNDELFLHFAPIANACGHLANGVVPIGETFLTVSVATLAGTTLAPGELSRAGLKVEGYASDLSPGACSPRPTVAPNAARGTLVITAIDANHVVGTYSGAPPQDPEPTTPPAPTITVDFDVPFCGGNGLRPAMCCVE